MNMWMQQMSYNMYDEYDWHAHKNINGLCVARGNCEELNTFSSRAIWPTRRAVLIHTDKIILFVPIGARIIYLQLKGW